MTPQSYSELLRDPRWQKKRLEILNRDEFTCQHCYETNCALHIHHKFYKKDRLPWEYEDSELITLCELCHSLEHEEKPCVERTCISGCVNISIALGKTIEHIFKLIPPDEQKIILSQYKESGQIDGPLYAFAIAKLDLLGN